MPNNGFADFVRKSDLDSVMRERDEARRELIWFKEQNDKLWSRIRTMELAAKEGDRDGRVLRNDD